MVMGLLTPRFVETLGPFLLHIAAVTIGLGVGAAVPGRVLNTLIVSVIGVGVLYFSELRRREAVLQELRVQHFGERRSAL